MSERTMVIEDAEAAYEDGDLDRALEICEQILEQNPDDADALYLMGEAMIELEEFEAAEEIFRDVLRLDPESGGIYNGLGISLFEQCRFDEAREALDTAIELNPRLPEALLYLGYFHERRGDQAEADDCFRRAHDLDPDHFFVPTAVSVEQLAEAVEQVLHGLPEKLRQYAKSAPWTIEALPTTAMLTAQQPALSPLTLCLLVGPERVPDETPEPLAHKAQEVMAFAANYGKMVQSVEELPAVILRSLLEEMGHFLELDLAEAEALGFDRLFDDLDRDAAAADSSSTERTLH